MEFPFSLEHSLEHSNMLVSAIHTQIRSPPDSKHNNLRSHSHFLAQISDALVLRAAPLLRETEFFLEFGILLFQRLELGNDTRVVKKDERRERERKERDLDTQ